MFRQSNPGGQRGAGGDAEQHADGHAATWRAHAGGVPCAAHQRRASAGVHAHRNRG